MSRVNVGVNPKYLSDQHLIAESVEITMITGSLRVNNYQIKSEIPEIFSLGTGHINFFKNKLVYLNNRLLAVNNEMIIRNFNPSTKINLAEYPQRYLNDWKPTIKDSIIIRNRIAERLLVPKSGRDGKILYKFYSKTIGSELEMFIERLIHSELYIF